jgi:hypothetical protein
MTRAIIISGLALLLALLLLYPLAHAQEHQHPAADVPLHDKFYSRWMMPSDRNRSCCNRQDCAPARAFFENGKWMVWSKIRRSFIEVPKSAIESEADVPMGAHLCENSSGVLCFGVGTGG